jgi:hypothetical protein
LNRQNRCFAPAQVHLELVPLCNLSARLNSFNLKRQNSKWVPPCFSVDPPCLQLSCSSVYLILQLRLCSDVC